MTRQQLLNYISSPETLNSESLSMLENLISRYPYHNIARYLHLKNLQKLNDEQYDNYLKLTAIYAPDRAKLKEVLSELSDERKIRKSKKSVNEIIDKFISEEPRISKIVDETRPIKTDIPEQDESTIFDIATETLAKIYLKQGNKSMAIKIYDQLMLKFPDKSS